MRHAANAITAIAATPATTGPELEGFSSASPPSSIDPEVAMDGMVALAIETGRGFAMVFVAGGVVAWGPDSCDGRRELGSVVLVVCDAD